MKEEDYNAIPCIDPVEQAEFEKNKLLMQSIMDLLKGTTYATADNLLNQCLWEIKQKAVIS